MSFEAESREFIRVKVSVPVRYKFMSHTETGPEMDRIHEGSTTNLSSGGLLLHGVIPKLEWLSTLLNGSMVIGVNMILPTYEVPVKALTRVAWIEGLEEATQKARLGLRFKEITQEAEQEILRYIIKTQMP